MTNSVTKVDIAFVSSPEQALTGSLTACTRRRTSLIGPCLVHAVTLYELSITTQTEKHWQFHHFYE